MEKLMASNQVLLAKQQLKLDGKVYDVNAVLPHAKLPPRILDALLDSRRAVWRPKAKDFHPAPRDMAPAPAPKKSPPVVIIEDNDIVHSWRLTRDALVRVLDGNASLAMDILMAHSEARDLFRRASSEHQHRERRRLKTAVLPSASLMP
jgi:hypothetical protein